MEIPELSDYVIYFPPQDGFMIWTTVKQKEDGTWEYDWGLVKDESYATPWTKREAEGYATELQTKYGGTYEIRSRTKTTVTMTKA